MTLVVEPPSWRLQEFECALLVKEVATLSGETASWRGHQVFIENPVPEGVKRKLQRRVALGRALIDESGREELTIQHRLELAVGGTNGRKVTSHALHGLHPYKGKFYPQLARSLLNAYGVRHGSRVLDPFAGCGTTLIEASLLGLKGRGLDANPLAVDGLWVGNVGPVDLALTTPWTCIAGGEVGRERATGLFLGLREARCGARQARRARMATSASIAYPAPDCQMHCR